ncbi:MAG: hypothetical protein IJV92_01415 [Phascolarctobacterium sp.]|nr:hypothetical protein [Phascolarctobacterium sp.]
MAKKITEIEEGLKDWEFLKHLPKEISGFKLQEGRGIEGNILNLASFVNEEIHCSLDLIYTAETFDYTLVKNIGLHTFRDERFFNRDADKFAEAVLKNLPNVIEKVSRSMNKKLGYESKVMGFDTWNYWKTLPEKIGEYELFVTPDKPLEYINGSWVILDYSNFSKGNQIMFLYNSFRNELFAELKKGFMPLTTDLYNANKLEQLEKLIKQHLQETLNELEN